MLCACFYLHFLNLLHFFTVESIDQLVCIGFGQKLGKKWFQNIEMLKEGYVHDTTNCVWCLTGIEMSRKGQDQLKVMSVKEGLLPAEMLKLLRVFSLVKEDWKLTTKEGCDVMDISIGLRQDILTEWLNCSRVCSPTFFNPRAEWMSKTSNDCIVLYSLKYKTIQTFCKPS